MEKKKDGEKKGWRKKRIDQKEKDGKDEKR